MQFDDRKTARGFAALGGLVRNWREISQFLARYNKKYLGKIGKMGCPQQEDTYIHKGNTVLKAVFVQVAEFNTFF